MSVKKREKFKSTYGFVLASVGAAVGLGNLWMFPWRLGQFGGAAFLVPYLLFVYILGTTGLMGEFAFGRWAKKGAIGAYDKLLRSKGYSFGKYLGFIPILGTFGAAVFYSIVAGWVIRYLMKAISWRLLDTGNFQAFFDGIAGQPMSILWMGVSVVLATLIISFGVTKGIERLSKVLMPAFIIIFVVLMIRSLTLPGAMEGIKFLLIPDWSYLLKPLTWGMALGQAFFSVTITGAAMLVYGSYLDKDSDIHASALTTVSLDTMIALLAALTLIPATFAFGFDPGSGPALLFVTMPEIFNHMPASKFFVLLFFSGVFFATLTSVFVMIEVLAESFMDQLNWSRRKSVIVIGACVMIVAVPLATSMELFSTVIDLVTIYLIPVGGLICAFLFFWIFGVENAREQINIGAKRKVGKWWNPVAKYVFVGIAALIVILQILVGID